MAEVAGKPVLVVDDSVAVCVIVRAVLHRLGVAHVDEARDGSDALKFLRRRDYSLVISDWNMKPMTGYDLLRHIRADERLRMLPFVMMTVDTDPQKMIAAKRAGVNSCLIKPFDAVTLSGKIGAFLGSTPNVAGRPD